MKRSWFPLLAVVSLLAACAQHASPEASFEPAAISTSAATDLFFSEYVEGSSNNKAIEIYNGTGAGVDLGAYRVELYTNGNTTFQNAINLSGTLAAGDVYVIANSSAAQAILDVADVTSGVTFFNGNDALVLLKNGQRIDSIGEVGDSATWGLEVTLRRKATVMAGDPVANDAFDRTVEWDEFAQDTFDGLGCHLGTCVVEPEPEVEVGLCGDPATPIHDVQGTGSASPLAGEIVTIEGIVVGDFQKGDGDPFDSDLDGFFVQEEDADADADAATSEGIFVYAPGAVDVQVGDVVRVLGEVEEFNGLTELTNVKLSVCAAAAALPAATPVAFPLESVGDLEAFEGMLVTFPQDLLISEYFNFDRFGEVVLANPIDPYGRHYQPTSYLDPSAATTQFETIALNRITLDDGRTVQNPSTVRHPDGTTFDDVHRFRGGDTLTNVTGVLNYAFGIYRIQPTVGADYAQSNPRPLAPDPVGGNVTVAAFNVLNYFSTIDSGPDVCGPLANQDCRGADNAEEFERQRDKIFAALEGLDADIVGLIELENDAADAALLDLVAGLNDVVGAGTYAAVETGAIGPDAIRVALIYKPANVTLVGDHAVLDTPEFLDPNDSGGAQNRPALAQTFVPVGGGHAVTVVVNHLKSKGSSCGAGDDDVVQGNCNLTRTLAAAELLEWLAMDPTGSGSPHVLLVGDLNAYDEEDPIDVLTAGGFGDLLERFSGEDAYTYVFDGLLGHLDYALASSSLAARVTGATAWAINADEPDVLDYDTGFKSAGPGGPVRARPLPLLRPRPGPRRPEPDQRRARLHGGRGRRGPALAREPRPRRR